MDVFYPITYYIILVGIIWGDIELKISNVILFLMFIIFQTSRFKQSDLKLGTLFFFSHSNKQFYQSLLIKIILLFIIIYLLFLR